MALAALNLTQLGKELKTAEQSHADVALSPRILPLGIPSIDAVLPQQGLAFGTVVEVQVRGASGAATSFALSACRAAQFHFDASRWSGSTAVTPGHQWCAFVDPSATLFAPGIAQFGVDLERLLVVRPDMKSVERVAVRIAEAKVASVLVIDGRGALGDLSLDARRWQRTVRRLSLIVRSLPTCVLLLTRADNRAALPLPVAMRLELNRASRDSFQIHVAKERTGRISPPSTLPWSVFHSEFRGATSTGVAA
jgi:hypothetical protein